MPRPPPALSTSRPPSTNGKQIVPHMKGVVSYAYVRVFGRVQVQHTYTAASRPAALPPTSPLLERIFKLMRFGYGMNIRETMYVHV